MKQNNGILSFNKTNSKKREKNYCLKLFFFIKDPEPDPDKSRPGPQH